MSTINLILRKDPEGNESFQEGGSAMDINNANWQPPTPFNTMEEYEEKLEEFLSLQEELFKISAPDLEIPAGMSNILTTGKPTRDIETIVTAYSRINFATTKLKNPLRHEGALVQKIFGENWKERAITKKTPVDHGDTFHLRHYRFKELFDPNKILLTYKKEGGTYINFLIDKRNFKDEELYATVRIALLMHATLLFSTHLYGGRFWVHNPCHEYLVTLVQIIGSLASHVEGKLPKDINLGQVLGWYPTDKKGEECLRIEMPFSDYKDETHVGKFRVANVRQDMHMGTITEGEKVWAMMHPKYKSHAFLLSVLDD